MLHSLNDKIVYANKTQEPAFSSSNEAKEEVQRISQNIGGQPKIIDMPHRSALGDGFIAVWGDVVLTPVDTDNITKLADGKSPKLGFLVDFITDFQRSAKNGLPVYRIGGGAGLVLAVSYGKPDQGTLRLIAVDALQFRSPVANVIAQPPTATDQNPIGAQPSPSPERTATVARTSQTRGQSPNDAQPSLQPPAKESEPQANIAELKHTISSLRSELATSTAKVTRLENQLLESERQLKQEAQGRLNAEAAKRQTEQAMLQTRNATQLWTILADVLIGSLIALLVILAPTLWNRFKNANIASNLPDLDQWLGYFERWLSSILEKVPVPREFSRANSGGLSVKNVAETEVTAQPS
jgi:flagellar biosynthesis GTPase FlhF